MSKELLFQKISQLSPQQATAYASMRKSTTVSVLLTLFLGGIGIQWFYMGKPLWGILSIIFCWTFIPSICALIYLFLASSSVRDFNIQLLDNLLSSGNLAA